MRSVALRLAAAAAMAISVIATPQGIDLAFVDASVKPGDDFFAYANGAWIKATPIPEDRSAYGMQAMVQDLTRDRIAALITDSARRGASGDERKIGDFYASLMDDAAVDAKELRPIRSQLDAIAAIRDKRSLAAELGRSLRADVDPLNATNFRTPHLFGVFVAQALDDPTRNVAYLLQGGLDMPDRDYYLSTGARMTEIRAAYGRHVESMLKLAGDAEAVARAKASRIVAFETEIARVHATRTESGDVHRAARRTRHELVAGAPGVDWDVLLAAAGLGNQPRFVLWHPDAVAGLAALVDTQPLETWKDWLAFHALDDDAMWLPRAFAAERFAFHGTVLTGAPVAAERWKRSVDQTNTSLGWLVGRLYVTRYFSSETRARVQAMSRNLVTAFGKRIDGLAWMSPATKAKARAKLAALTIGIGYPDRWPDYSLLEIVPGDPLGNVRRAALFEYRRALAKLGRPPDPSEWWMTPQTVNAVNLPLQNALNIPAARLQTPYLDANGDEASDYGAVGGVLGHEISHSFDDMGSEFDAEGRLSNWWVAEDRRHFNAAAERLVAQYDAYKPFADLAVNGRQTLSENIADVAGLSIALDAFRRSASAAAPPRGGFTALQRFFIGYAQTRVDKRREAARRNQIATDGHAPSEYRADTVRNLDAWYDAFQVEPGQRLYLAPADRVRIW